VERRIIAKLRNRQFLSFDELCEAVEKELDIINTKPFQKLPSNRLETFLETEKAELQPLPGARFEYAEWKMVKAAFDYHVPFGEHYYSIPYIYAGKQVELRATAQTIEVFHDHERIAVHPRCYEKRRRFITCGEHMPKKHRVMADWTPERFESWARKTGPETAAYMRYLMERREHPEQAFKTCAGILRMAENIPAPQMEAVCKRAMVCDIYSYKYFSMLLKNMTPAPKQQPIRHANLRGSSYYGGEDHA